MNESWRLRALCRSFRYSDLPWIAEPEDMSIGAVITMELVCAACPVRAACEAFVESHEITSGFYAGKDRTPGHYREQLRHRGGVV